MYVKSSIFRNVSVRVLCLIAGVVWGMVLGPETGLAVAGFLSGLNWAFITGTGTWPDWVDWLILGSGLGTGLAAFLTCFVIGRNVGDRLEFVPANLPQRGPAIPWAVVAAGLAVGGITATTIEEREQAVVDYVQLQKQALVRLESFAGEVQRFARVEVNWPGDGEIGVVSVGFRGEHTGEYRLGWEIWRARDKHKPFISGEYPVMIRAGDYNTDLPLPPEAIGKAYLHSRGDVRDGEAVVEDFTYRLRLVPKLTRAERAMLPVNEPDNIADGKSKLIDRIARDFEVRFRIRSGRVVWSSG